MSTFELLPVLVGVPVAVFGAGFLLGALPFSFATRLLLAMIIIVAAALYLWGQFRRRLTEIEGGPLSFFMRRFATPAAAPAPVPSAPPASQ